MGMEVGRIGWCWKIDRDRGTYHKRGVKASAAESFSLFLHEHTRYRQL